MPNEKKDETMLDVAKQFGRDYVKKTNSDFHRIMGTEKGKQLDKEIQDKLNDRYTPTKVLDAMERRDAANKERALENQKQYGMKKGGAVKSASARADGCAMRGKTKGKIV